MALSDVYKREVVRIAPETTARQAAILMRDKHVGTLIVVATQQGVERPVGILTDRDLVTKALTAREDPGHIDVRSIMSADPATAREGDDVLETIRLMEHAKVRRLPIVSANGHLVGVVSSDDLYRLLAEELNSLAHISPRQISAERLQQGGHG